MVQTIIRAVTALYENQQGHEYNAAYVESMNMRIKNIERMIIKGDSSYVDVILALNKALEKSFHFTIAFYYGLIAYAETHIEMETSPVFATLTHAEMIKDCEVAFLKTAGEKAYQCKRYAVGESINAFRILANKFSSSTENKERSISKTGNLLKSVIGRNYLCDVKMFNKLSDPVAAIINDAKHWNAGDGSQVALKAAENIDKVKDLLDFFIYNNDYLVEKRKKQLVSVDPIYPYVVRYCAKSENRDRYNIYNYVVNMSGDDMDMDVKLLTEKSCEINELYYCIPNMNGTLPKWWIKPFLIKCRDFDKLFLEPEKGDK